MTNKPHPDSPAVIREGHTQSRVLSTSDRDAKGWVNNGEHPLTLAFARGQIDADEFAAGEAYRALFEKMGRGGRDSTEFVIISGSRQPFTDAQVTAIRIIQAIEAELQKLDVDGSHWVRIVRKFCGEGHTGREAIRSCGDVNPRFTRQRIKLALSKLSTAISRTRIDFRVRE